MTGGQLATIGHIEDFPGFPQAVAGYDLGPMIQEQAAAAGAEFRMVEATGLMAIDAMWRIRTTEGDLDAKAVVIATGSRGRTLDAPGEACRRSREDHSALRLRGR